MGLFNQNKPTTPAQSIRVGVSVYGSVVPVYGVKRETRPGKQTKETR